MPSSGYEILSQASYSPSKKLKAVLRYKFEMKEENDAFEIWITWQLKKAKLSFWISYKISDAFRKQETGWSSKL